MQKDSPYRVDADYLEEDSTSLRDYASEYKREAILVGTTAAMYGTALAIQNSDDIVEFLNNSL